jgi:hypothetical protein
VQFLADFISYKRQNFPSFTLFFSLSTILEIERSKKMEKEKSDLNMELISLFDLKKSKVRDEKILTQLAFEAQRDIRYLTLMFCDGIPDISMRVTDTEIIRWDSKIRKLLYVKDSQIQLLEAAPREIRVKMKPFLVDLVKKAKEFYSDD